ncbi:YD repeat-containing protein [Xanthomonas translucens]
MNDEYGSYIKGAQQPKGYGADLFGDKTNLYTGATAFSVVDISLPGNSNIPVQIGRRFQVKKRGYYLNKGPFADWDLDIPYLTGVFSRSGGWQVSGSTQDQRNLRCSVPEAAPEIAVDLNSIYPAEDYWAGNQLHLPNEGDMEMVDVRGYAEKYGPKDGLTYTWGSQNNWFFSCLPSTENGVPGEAFLAHAPNGDKYWFNHIATRDTSILKAQQRPLPRVEVFIYPTRVEDRFGNWVVYTYDAANPMRLISIEASDGRRLSLSYDDQGHVSNITDGSRSWNYSYVDNGHSSIMMSQVTLPDGSKWKYDMAAAAYVQLDPYTQAIATCDATAQSSNLVDAVAKIEHPSGAIGEFSFSVNILARAGVTRSCMRPPGSVEIAVYPRYYAVVGLKEKRISGPALPEYKWGFDYGKAEGSWQNECSAGCVTTRSVKITGPESIDVYTYGIKYMDLEGRLLKRETMSAKGAALRTESYTYKKRTSDDLYSKDFGFWVNSRSDRQNGIAPIASISINQDGVDYKKNINNFDYLARPTVVTEYSPWTSRSENLTYYDDLAKWVISQPATKSVNGITVSSIEYNSDAMPTAVREFGKVNHVLTYDNSTFGQLGVLKTSRDGNDHVTKYENWKRGIPQVVTYADGVSRVAAVNESGWITSLTDENGYITNYSYDPLGRLVSIGYASGDSVAWNATTLSFSQVNATEYGLAPGHWKQTVSTGNARKQTYFDALWRPIVTLEYDAGAGATQRFQRFAYDQDGRQIFSSYAGVSDNLTVGKWTTYDALGRIVSVSQDSEQGLLTTLTEYLQGNQTRVTDPRGNQTVTGYQVFDKPDYTAPIWIQHPEGAYTDINRDIFGKPLSIRRRDANGTVSVTRSYVYDGYQQLCKTVEPETGASVNGYDAAGNLVWSASGLSLPSSTSCDADAAFASGRRVDRSYDVRNRIKTLSFPDGNGNQAWSYWPGGAIKQITTTNNGVATYNSYAYNKRHLLIAESQGQADGETWAMGYAYDANGNLAAHRYPSGQTVGYAPNALGQPTQAGSYATGVSYYPNGAIKQFTYGNGIVHTLTQNARQLPAVSQDAYNGTAFLSDGYTYDVNGNVASISDGATGRSNRGNRSMVYDGLDRLTTATSPMFGTASYSYDVLDNLTHVVAPGRDHYYCYDVNWQLTNVKAGGCGGSTVIGMSYDPQGNLSNKNGQAFVFDYGNRLRQATGKESYRYDGNGRRTLAMQNAGNIGSLYDQAGALRFQKNQRQSKSTDYILLGGSLVAEADWPLGQLASVKDYVNWTPVSGATRYVVEESVDGVTWTSVYDGSQGNWTSLARPAGTFSYRVTACTADGNCSAVSNVTHDQRPAVDIVPLLYQLLLSD